MPEELEEFPPNDTGRAPLYDWNAWLDGGIYKLRHGEDFQTRPESIRSEAYRAATERGGKVRTSLGTDNKGDFCVLQFLPNGKK